MDLKFPVGPFAWSGSNSNEDRSRFIAEIAATPERLRRAVTGLSTEQLEIPYRPGGWNVRQVVHHLPESHMNSYIRFKLALTEDHPTVKPYDESRWAETEDTRRTDIHVSLDLLDSLHLRWVVLLRSLTPTDLQRTFQHPDLGTVSLDRNLALYAWHGAHHIAHITTLRERMGWQ